MLRTAEEVLASHDVQAIVDFGIELDRTIKADGAQLEKIKEFLRGLGEKKLGQRSAASRLEAKTLKFEGNLGNVSITFPADAPCLKKGVDLKASEAGIPEHVFGLLFKKRVVYDLEKDFLKKLGTLDDEDRGLISNITTLQPATPRVIWPK